MGKPLSFPSPAGVTDLADITPDKVDQVTRGLQAPLCRMLNNLYHVNA